LSPISNTAPEFADSTIAGNPVGLGAPTQVLAAATTVFGSTTRSATTHPSPDIGGFGAPGLESSTATPHGKKYVKQYARAIGITFSK
jgi:hypothetical protein